MLEALDTRGILHSIASRNEYQSTMDTLKEFGMQKYFLYPQIGWGTKSAAIKMIGEKLNIGLDTILFVDDQQFEREEVMFALPEVRSFDAARLDQLLELEELTPKVVTEDSRYRRERYLSDIARAAAEEAFEGPSEAFLASLHMSLALHQAGEGDLHRAEELTLRTNQLNATGVTYSYSELDELRRSANHSLVIADLADRFGSYGKIGLALIERASSAWRIRLLLMSCRVMSRGVGTVLLREIIQRAQAARVELVADFVPTSRNRMMYVAYQFAGFREHLVSTDRHVLRHDGSTPPARPAFMTIDATF